MKHAVQRGGKSETGVGMSPRETSCGPLIEEEGMERSQRENIVGPHITDLSRTQSLNGPLKDYLENIEKAFVRDKFKIALNHQVNQRKSSVSSLKGVTSEDSSVSVVQETRDSSENRKSEQDQERDASSFRSISATRKEDELGGKLVILKRRTCKKRFISAKPHGIKTRNCKNRGSELSPR